MVRVADGAAGAVGLSAAESTAWVVEVGADHDSRLSILEGLQALGVLLARGGRNWLAGVVEPGVDIGVHAEADAALVISEVVLGDGLARVHLVAKLLIDLVASFQLLVVEATLGMEDVRRRSGTCLLRFVLLAHYKSRHLVVHAFGAQSRLAADAVVVRMLDFDFRVADALSGRWLWLLEVERR